MRIKTDYNSIASTPNGANWKNVSGGLQRGALTWFYLPVYKNGEFQDMKGYIDWSLKCGFRGTIARPFHPPGYQEYPFAAKSTFANWVRFLSLRNIRGVEQGALNQRFGNEIKKHYEMYPPGNVDFYNSAKDKLRILRLVFDSGLVDKNMQGKFSTYQTDTKYWLPSWTEFAAKGNLHSDDAWWNWQPDKNPSVDDLEFQAWVQFQLDMDLKDVSKYAADRKFLLVLSMPFAPAIDSAEIHDPNLRKNFHTNLKAAAPPEPNIEEVQLWDNHVRNLDHMAQDDFSYYLARMAQLQRYTGVIYGDHVFGHERVGSCEINEHGRASGQFRFHPYNESTWANNLTTFFNLGVKSGLVMMAEECGVPGPNFLSVKKKFGVHGLQLGACTPEVPIANHWSGDMYSFSTPDLPQGGRIITAIKPEDRRLFESGHGLNFSLDDRLTSQNWLEALEAGAKSPCVFHVMDLRELLAIKDPKWVLDEDCRENIPGTTHSTNFHLVLPEGFMGDEIVEAVQGVLRRTERHHELSL